MTGAISTDDAAEIGGQIGVAVVTLTKEHANFALPLLTRAVEFDLQAFKASSIDRLPPSINRLCSSSEGADARADDGECTDSNRMVGGMGTSVGAGSGVGGGGAEGVSGGSGGVADGGWVARNAEFVYYLAYANGRMGNRSAAVQWLEEVLLIEPDHADARKMLGVLQKG
jgi:hypothetical protein